jgi:putative flippase GtrA
MSRYILIGVWNSFFGIASFYILSAYLTHALDLVILGLSYFISIIQAHFTQRKFVWRSRAAYFPELFKFSLVYVFQFIINAILLLASKIFLSTPRELNQTLIVILLTMIFYFINKKGVFHEESR